MVIVLLLHSLIVLPVLLPQLLLLLLYHSHHHLLVRANLSYSTVVLRLRSVGIRDECVELQMGFAVEVLDLLVGAAPARKPRTSSSDTAARDWYHGTKLWAYGTLPSPNLSRIPS